MIDVGFWEFAMIGVLALIVLGPERLPGVARTAGAWLGKARRMMNDIKSDIKSELDEAELSELKNIRDDIQEAGKTFKSQVESGEKKVQSEGSMMDTAIADALNKPAPAADKDPAAESATVKKPRATKKKNAKKNAGKKKVGKKSTARKKVTKKKAAVSAAIQPDSNPATEKPG